MPWLTLINDSIVLLYDVSFSLLSLLLLDHSYTRTVDSIWFHVCLFEMLRGMCPISREKVLGWSKTDDRGDEQDHGDGVLWSMQCSHGHAGMYHCYYCSWYYCYTTPPRYNSVLIYPSSLLFLISLVVPHILLYQAISFSPVLFLWITSLSLSPILLPILSSGDQSYVATGICWY